MHRRVPIASRTLVGLLIGFAGLGGLGTAPQHSVLGDNTGSLTVDVDVHALRACTDLAGTGATLRLAIVPAGYDDRVPAQRAEFEGIARTIAEGFASTEPFASHMDRLIIQRVDDYRGRALDPWSCAPLWHNASLIQAAAACDHTHILVVPRRSGCVGGHPAGNYSMAGPGHCPAGDCDPDQIVFTTMHELGHTLAGFAHVCYPGDPRNAEWDQEIRTAPPIFLPWSTTGASVGAQTDVSVDGNAQAIRPPLPRTALRNAVQSKEAQAGDTPLNCGVGFEGDEDSPCREWQSPEVLRWVLPGDPPHGCFQGCDDQAAWYRPWPHAEPAVMCRDDAMKNGFTPVERKILFDLLMKPPPPRRASPTPPTPATVTPTRTHTPGAATPTPTPTKSLPGLITYVRYASDASRNDIYVSQPDGKGEIQITDTDDDERGEHPNYAGEFPAHWMPDGRDLVYYTSDVFGEEWKFWLIDRFGGARRLLYTERAFSAEAPIPNPDGSKILYTRSGVQDSTGRHPNDLYLLDVGTRRSSPLVVTQEREELHADWSPDGRTIVYDSGELPPASVLTHLRMVGADGSNDRPFIVPDGERASRPRWSPDGTKIAYYRGAVLHVHELTTGTDTPLLTGADCSIAWSPDSSEILFLARTVPHAAGRPSPTPSTSAQPEGLYRIRLADRTITRLQGAAGGAQLARGDFSYGICPDWWHPR